MSNHSTTIKDKAHKGLQAPRVIMVLLSTLAIVVAMTALGTAPANATDTNNEHKVSICHWADHKFIPLSVSQHAVRNNDDLGNGHGKVTGEDIIPPFENYGGLNYGTDGQAIYNNGNCDGNPDPIVKVSQAYCAVHDDHYTPALLKAEGSTADKANAELKSKAADIRRGIIPAFGTAPNDFAGLNYGTDGQAIYNNGKCDGTPVPIVVKVSQAYCAVSGDGYTPALLKAEGPTADRANAALKNEAGEINNGIIPAFGTAPNDFAGLNYGTDGQAIYNNGNCDGTPVPVVVEVHQDYCAVAEVGYSMGTLTGVGVDTGMAEIDLFLTASKVLVGIIPPFGQGKATFEGLNWTEANQVTYRNECQVVTPTPTPTPTETPAPTPPDVVTFHGTQAFCAVNAAGGYLPDAIRIDAGSQALVDEGLVVAARTLTSGIVPAFTAGAQSFAGLNWGADGQLIYAAGACNGVVPVISSEAPTTGPTTVTLPEAATVPQTDTAAALVDTVSVPEAATVPTAVAAGDGGTQSSTPIWVYALLMLGLAGIASSTFALTRRSIR